MTRTIVGKVISGTGRGAKFVALPIYEEIFEKLLGDSPFYGTLNLRINEDIAGYVDEQFEKGQVFEDLEYEGEEYGGIITIPAEIVTKNADLNAVAVRPHLTTHDNTVVELVSSHYLREYLELEDGDKVEFKL